MAIAFYVKIYQYQSLSVWNSVCHLVGNRLCYMTSSCYQVPRCRHEKQTVVGFNAQIQVWTRQRCLFVFWNMLTESPKPFFFKDSKLKSSRPTGEDWRGRPRSKSGSCNHRRRNCMCVGDERRFEMWRVCCGSAVLGRGRTLSNRHNEKGERRKDNRETRRSCKIKTDGGSSAVSAVSTFHAYIMDFKGPVRRI